MGGNDREAEPAGRPDWAGLLAAARRAAEAAYAPYSGLHVGAALLAASGRVYLGCNVENASYGLTVCAERVAVWKAVSEGEREFVALAVSGPAGVALPPCGACRQVLAEFDPHLPVAIPGPDDRPAVHSLDELLAHPFLPAHAAAKRAGRGAAGRWSRPEGS